MSNRRRTRPARPAAQVSISAPPHAPFEEELALFDLPEPAPDLASAIADLIGTLLGDTYGISGPLEAELGLAMLLGLGEVVGVDQPQWQAELLSRLAGVGNARAAGMVTAATVLTEGTVRAQALEALDRMATAGIRPPAWASQLAKPVRARALVSLDDQDGDVWALTAVFSRGADEHGFVIVIEPDDCGAASELVLTDPGQITAMMRSMKKHAAKQRCTLTEVILDPAEFRWRAEVALDARAVHDEDDRSPGELEDLMDEDGPGYQALAPLLHARLRTLPKPGRPKPPHREAPISLAEASGIIAKLLNIGPGPVGRSGRDDRPPALPARQKRKSGAAPILQIRVDLRGARPPIWRRLQVPADITLARLHDVLQTAFGWTDDHLHVFETAYGSFGRPSADLGHRSDGGVTLEQVAAAAGDKITYTYDFGDDWEHVIAVERVLPREPGHEYPRCTGGRRAAPPEDCGGIWGYEYLLDVLADPDHEEHADKLEWLGLNDAGQLDPAAFDQGQINKVMSARSG